MKKIIFLSIFFLGSAFFFCGCFGEDLSLDELLRKGLSAATNGDWENAKKFSARAVKLSPSSVNALTLYSLALENTGNADAALGAISKAVTIDENNYFAQYTKGRLLYEKKHFDSSIAPLRQALKLRPSSADPLILLAQSSVNLNNAKDAKIYYSMLARNPKYARNPAPWSELGMTFIYEAKPAAAAQYLLYAYRLQPENPKLLLNLGAYYDLYLKNRPEAIKYYTRFLTLTKQNSAMAQKRNEVEARLQTLR